MKKTIFIITNILFVLSIYSQENSENKDATPIPNQLVTDTTTLSVSGSINANITKNESFTDTTNFTEEPTSHKRDKIEKYKPTLGVGIGLDYGGFMGANILIYPKKKLGAFIGMGTNLTGFGFNVGGKFIFAPDTSDIKPFFIGMIGNNTSITVPASEKYNKVFYGPSIGIGFDYMPKDFFVGYWSFSIIIPFRSVKVNEYITELREEKNVVSTTSLYPILLSAGYRFNF